MSAESAALQALERRIRAQVKAQVDAIASNFGAYLGAVVKGFTGQSAIELLSREDVNAALTAVLAGAEVNIEKAIRAGYRASAQLGKAATARELRPLGHAVPRPMPDLGGYLDSVVADARSAVGSLLFDIHDGVREAHDGVTGPGAAAYRVLTTNAALKRAVRRFGVRVNAAGTTAVHRGFSDAQAVFYSDYAAINPYVRLRKRWKVTSGNPCEHCAALDGTTVALDAQFDATAGSQAAGRVLPAYRDLHAPPRHPHCGCRMELVTS